MSFIYIGCIFLLSTELSKAQNPRNYFIAHDLDSAGYEWTAMTKDWNDRLIISTVAESSSGPAYGPLRLRIHSNLGRNETPQSSTITSAGSFRVFNMHYDGALWMTGAYKGTSYLGNDTLLATATNNLNPFLALFDPNTNNYVWVWHDSLAGNNYFQKVRAGNANQIIASGIANDSMGWVAAFNAANGQLLWDKKLPGVRTISDARPFPNDTASFLVTGTMADSGSIFQAPLTLNGAGTGYRNFLARLYPAIDSVEFLHHLPGHAFDFEPAIVKRSGSWFPDYVWSTPFSTANSSARAQMVWDITSRFILDTLLHEFYYQNVEEQQYPIENLVVLKTPGINPQLFDLRSTTGTFIGQFAFSQGTQAPFLANLSGAALSLAFRSTGSVQVDLSNWNFYNDSTLFFPNVSPNQPKWVLITTVFIISSVPQKSAVQFTVYPNPVNQGQFKIQTELGFDQPAAWTLRDVQGRAVRQGQLADAAESISTTGLVPGMYFFELESPKGRGVQKLIVP